MTVCIAGLFRWNYGTLTSQRPEAAALVITDRMITAGDVQYEPQQTKIGSITPLTILVISGDYSVHTQAVKSTAKHFNKNPNASPHDIATFYGREIQRIKLKEAEDLFLAPMGLNADTFLAQQKDMAPETLCLMAAQ